MEDTLRAVLAGRQEAEIVGLNPYSNGRYSESDVFSAALLQLIGVLILILMEDTLRELYFNLHLTLICQVLILILMEDTLRV